MDEKARQNPVRQIARTMRMIFVAYAQVYFSRRAISGFLFLAATFIHPLHGLAGLTGLIFAGVFAWLIGQPREHISDGFFGFNGLLVGLALGLFFRFSPTFIFFTALAVFFSVIVAATLRNLSTRYIGAPVLSTPFVLASWTALLATRRFYEVRSISNPLVESAQLEGLFPLNLELYFKSLGAAFFQLNVLSGVLIFIGLLIFSRWATILSIIGFSTGFAVYAALGGMPADLDHNYIGFNFILTAMAVGGVWIVLSPSSIIYAAVGGALASMMSAGLLSLLTPYGLPVLAMPFITVTSLMLFVIIIRPDAGRLKLVRGDWESPESDLNKELYRAKRYPDPKLPVVYLPVTGRWIVTQGPNGDETHKGRWNHAWDFEVEVEGGAFRDDGAKPEDYYAFKAPVFSPGDAKVIRVVDHIEDNPIGEVDTTNNWGNCVILWHSGNIFSALCHLKKGSVAVKEGEMVTAKTLLGRVGNSGRSPRPHLHFQLQSSGQIGAPTIYGEFLHYQIPENGKLRYVTHGCPDTGDEVISMTVEDSIRRAFTMAPGRRWDWAVASGAKRFSETWESEIDSLGNRRIVLNGDRAAKAHINFFADNHYTTMLDYKGSSHRLLGLLYLGLPRVPYIEGEKTVWDDNPSAASFLSPPVNLVRELALPFAEIVKVQTTSGLKAEGHRVVVTTMLQVNSSFPSGIGIPEKIEIEFIPEIGPAGIRAWDNGRIILSAELGT